MATLRASIAAVLCLSFSAPAWAEPPAETLETWAAYERATEARIEREIASGSRFLARDFETDSAPGGAAVRRAAMAGELVISPWNTPQPSGRAWDVPRGQIHHWIGTVFVPGVDLSTLLERLHGTEVQLRQPDVLAARVLTRSADGMALYLKLRRSQIVTVTYDTEHRVRFARLDASRATSTSVATRIVELEDAGTTAERPVAAGEDRGFLWRLNAYWRYQAVAGGVLVECESLSLSRRVPFGLGTVVSPFVTRIARESMARTLVAMREVLGRPAPTVFTARTGGL
jgi:hypothetical protein